ncbi:MAG: hypothetical protein M1828_007070 [Chrysothrix sp. TS-e1954]|nr:MAG: hypothetical protein M1828_007070 [Chrysothrix sp. TS-e1954]
MFNEKQQGSYHNRIRHSSSIDSGDPIALMSPRRTTIPFDLLTRDYDIAAQSMPLLHREEDNHLTTFDPHAPEHLSKQLIPTRLHEIEKYLWLAGRPYAPPPLHRQLLLGRTILLTEQLDLHLVWSIEPLQIFLKPLPAYLLDTEFWERHLLCKSTECICSLGTSKGQGGGALCAQQAMYRDALGLLQSYIAMLVSQSDFDLAIQYRLLPADIIWQEWRSLVQRAYSASSTLPPSSPRYRYGQLRLGRLNAMYRLIPSLASISRSSMSHTGYRGYFHRYRDYAALIRTNFSWLLAGTAYVVVVLTAMQVGLATERLGNSRSFQNASFGFTAFSILFPVAGAGIVSVVALILSVKTFFDARHSRNQVLNAQSG